MALKPLALFTLLPRRVLLGNWVSGIGAIRKLRDPQGKKRARVLPPLPQPFPFPTRGNVAD